MPTKIVRTFELKVASPKTPGRIIVYCTGSKRTCADHAAYEMSKSNRQLSEASLDAFTSELYKQRAATLDGCSFQIVPLEEEYEMEEDE